uniref:Uncharacterized protein n=1 Tax=Rhizophora mucronata TaxID=61149 RepID=A0A2P2NA82_RHIMU
MIRGSQSSITQQFMPVFEGSVSSGNKSIK